MLKNTQEALTIIKNKAKVRTFRNKPQVSSNGGTSTQIDATAALTKQVEALGYHIASMQETYDCNQEAAIQLMQNQMGQMAKALQERPSCVPPNNTVTKPRAELKAITTMDGLTLDGSSIPHSNLLVYQESKTITEVVEIASSQSTPLVPPSETPPLSTPKLKENLKPNPHQPPIPCPSRLQNDKFHALKNLTGRVNHFIYRIDIVDSLCDKFPIENNSFSGNPTPSSDYVVESLSSLPTPFGDSDSLMEETDILLSHFNDSSPDHETFCFDVEEKSSGSTTSHSDHSLPEYETFCFDVNHIKEKSSGSTTSHSDLSRPEYESFHLDLSIDPLPPADRSDSHHEELADELARTISSPKYDHFYFDIELTRRLEKNISKDSTKGLTSPELNDLRFLLSDCDSIFSEKFSEIDLLVLFPSENKDKVFDPGIFTINGVHSKRFSILLLDDFSSILFVIDFLFLTDPSEIETFLSFPFGNKDKVFDPGILLNNEIFSSRENLHIYLLIIS
ncbi:hypothetical protein Tco_0911002 [Tanacetum coccineum]|uniref:Reverse transcriptase domain-containing protein n=1 Tax=Tanacetum coccineum TaxID=301880 RepID=A0ABQ5CW67_9ASTR